MVVAAVAAVVVVGIGEADGNSEIDAYWLYINSFGRVGLVLLVLYFYVVAI